MPIRFEANHGQVHEDVKFFGRAGGYTIFITLEALVLAPSSPTLDHENSNTIDAKNTVGPHLPRVEPETLPDGPTRVEFVGAKPDPRITGEKPLPGKTNYFLGNNPEEWVTGVPAYEEIVIEGLWPNIVVVLSSNPHRTVQIDYVVQPGGDLDDVQFNVESMDMAVGPRGSHPFMPEALIRNPVDFSDLLSERGVHHEKSITDANHPVPQVEILSGPLVSPVYSTYLGGNDWDEVWGIASDQDGSTYLGGFTSSIDFPIDGAYQPGYAGGLSDAFVTKLAPSGDEIEFSTYLGGSNVDLGLDLAIDQDGNVYITGDTESDDFPLKDPYQDHAENGVAFVTKLAQAGDELVYSTYLGGNKADSAKSIAVGRDGKASITGRTDSSDFPTKNAFQKDHPGGEMAAFVSTLDVGGNSLHFSTYLGGSDLDEGHAIALDPLGNAYVTGFTMSPDFPTANPYQDHLSGEVDAFVTKIHGGGDLAYSSYLGGSGADFGIGIVVDDQGHAHVTGQTHSEDFPHGNIFGPHGEGDAFLSKVEPTGSDLKYSAILGGSSEDIGLDVALDLAGMVYLTGWTSSRDFPLQDAFQLTYGGWQDTFIVKVSIDSKELVYSTYVSGARTDVSRAITVDQHGDAYVAGETTSRDFPTTDEAYQPDHPSGLIGITIPPPTGFVTKLSHGQMDGLYIPRVCIENIVCTGPHTPR